MNTSPLKSLNTPSPKKYSTIPKSSSSQGPESQQTAAFPLSEARAAFTQTDLSQRKNLTLLKNLSLSKCSVKALKTFGNGSIAFTTCLPSRSPTKTISKSIFWPKPFQKWAKKSHWPLKISMTYTLSPKTMNMSTTTFMETASRFDAKSIIFRHMIPERKIKNALFVELK
jgi:hypothetical protein